MSNSRHAWGSAALAFASAWLVPLPVDATELEDRSAINTMYSLLQGGPGSARVAADLITRNDDERFIAPFIDLLGAAEADIVPEVPVDASVQVLQKLSDKQIGAEYAAWLEWYGGTDLEAPPGYLGWKGILYSRLDPRYGLIFRDEVQSRVRPVEMIWRGIGYDDVLPLNAPKLLDARRGAYLDRDAPVFGVTVNGEHRAYPLRIIEWHEVINDTVGGRSTGITYCPMTGAAVGYHSENGVERVLTLSAPALMYYSNIMLLDQETNSLWRQFTGEVAMGRLAQRPVALEAAPVVLMRWSDWRDLHPDSKVLDLNTGAGLPYIAGARFGEYYSSTELQFPLPEKSGKLILKEWVYGLKVGDAAKAYPAKTLAEEKVVNDSVGGTNVVLVAPHGTLVAKGRHPLLGVFDYSLGAEVRAYKREDVTFKAGESDYTLVDGDGGEWKVTEEALIGPGGKRAPRLPGQLAYWFAWYAFHPDTEVFE